jgi:serine/threonine protein kinase
LLCGFAPFSGDDDLETLSLVASAPLEFPSPEWDAISDEAKDFVSRLLERNPDKRPSADQAMHHPWIAKYIVPPGIPKPLPFKKRALSERDSSSIRLDSEKLSAFQKFLATIKVKKALKSVSEVISPKEAQFLCKILRKIDQDNNGKIGVSDIDRAVETGRFQDAVSKRLEIRILPLSCPHNILLRHSISSVLGDFSSSVKDNLMQMRNIMNSTTRSGSFDIFPFLEATEINERGMSVD